MADRAVPSTEVSPAGGVVPDFTCIIELVAEEDRDCSECILGIKEGEGYAEISGKWDGVIEEYDLCLRCNLRRQEVRGGYIIGKLHERHLEQHGPQDQLPEGKD